MTSEVSIANQALAYLGEPRIQSLDQNTNSAKAANDMMRPSIEEVLELHDWNECRARVKPASLADAPAFGFSKAYQLPADFIRLISINEDEIDYELEGGKIFTDEDDIELRYIAYPSSVTVIRPALARAISAKLAQNISVIVTGEAAMQDKMLALFERMLARARTNNARESSSNAQSLYYETMRDSEMLRTRNQSFRYGRGPYRRR